MTKDQYPAEDAQATIPPHGRVVGPIIWGVIEKWHQREPEVETWEDACRLIPPQYQDWAGLVEQLQLINAFQWQAEDRSREPGASDQQLAAIKRIIDASNRRRVRAVEALDHLLFDRLREEGMMAPAAPLHSESPGSIVDRLTVLALKVFYSRSALATARRQPSPADPPPLDAASAYDELDGHQEELDPQLVALYERLRGVAEQMVDLTECLDRLLADLQAGRTRFKVYRQVKVFRDLNTGALRDGTA